MSNICILFYLRVHKDFINTYTNPIQWNLQNDLALKFWSQYQDQTSKIKIDLPRCTYGIRQHCLQNIEWLLFMALEKLSRQRFCSEGHQVEVKSQIYKVTSLSTTTCHDDVIYRIWALFKLYLLSNPLSKISQKCNVQGHHAKVKGQMSKIYISFYLGAHREFIDTYTNQIWPNFQNDLDLHFQLPTTVPRSKVKYQDWPA